jgi:hypothetical protein
MATVRFRDGANSIHCKFVALIEDGIGKRRGGHEERSGNE